MNSVPPHKGQVLTVSVVINANHLLIHLAPTIDVFGNFMIYVMKLKVYIEIDVKTFAYRYLGKPTYKQV